MTDLQHDLIKRLSHGQCFLFAKAAHSGRRGYMLYTGNMNPEKWYSDKTVKDSVYDQLKKDKKGRLTLNLSEVRKLHGKSLLKIFYKQKLKSNGTRSNKPGKSI